MSRLIDADALKAVCDGIINCEWNHKTAPVSWADAYEGFEDDIDAAPTVDAIPVEWLIQRQDEAYGAVYYCGGNVEKNAEIMRAIRTVLELWQKEQEGR